IIPRSPARCSAVWLETRNPTLDTHSVTCRSIRAITVLPARVTTGGDRLVNPRGSTDSLLSGGAPEPHFDKDERMAKSKGDYADMSLAPMGRKRIDWAENDMPVLRQVRERFEKEKTLKDLRMSCCLHITAETANLARTLKAGGA